MKQVILAAAITVVIAALTGCGSTPEERAMSTQASHVPPGAKNVVVLGKDWYTFELDVGGKNRKFLYRSRGMGTNYATETITELKD